MDADVVASAITQSDKARSGNPRGEFSLADLVCNDFIRVTRCLFIPNLSKRIELQTISLLPITFIEPAFKIRAAILISHCHPVPALQQTTHGSSLICYVARSRSQLILLRILLRHHLAVKDYLAYL